MASSRVGGDAWSWAGGCAFGMGGAADVVAVEAAATVGSDSDVGAVAGGAPQQTAEQVVRRVGHNRGSADAALAEQLLGPVEGLLVEDRFVFAVV